MTRSHENNGGTCLSASQSNTKADRVRAVIQAADELDEALTQCGLDRLLDGLRGTATANLIRAKAEALSRALSEHYGEAQS